MSQDVRAFNPLSIAHLQRNVDAADALRRKINRAEADTELWLARKAVSGGVTLSNDPYLLQERIPVLRAVPTASADAAKVAPIRSSKPKASCGFGDCQKDAHCTLQCPDKPSAKALAQTEAEWIRSHPTVTGAKESPGPNCAPAGICEGKATCSDRHCQGHPANADQNLFDPAARAFFWRLYLGGMAIMVLLGAALLASSR